ncbi:N-acetyltransferase family protein [Jatrophihabitans sp. YIM 134969]
MDGPTIRRAGPADADTVADVYLRSRAGAGDAIPPGVHPDHEVRDFVATVVVPRREAWLACGPTGEALGVLVLDGDDLDWLWVVPEAQGQGVGTALLAHAEQLRPDGLALWVFASNTPARAFYERRGWRAVRTTDGDNEEGAPDVRYVRGNHWEAG